MTTEPWSIQWNDKTVVTRVPAEELFPNNDGDLHWLNIPRPKEVDDHHELVHVDYDEIKGVDAYWQDVREFDHLILD